jgi:transcriptional regulator with XRE-family HTH domain
MQNPLVSLRTLSELTQAEVAHLTGTSQQFVQRLEQGASTHVADSLTTFYDRTVDTATRRGVFADLLVEAQTIADEREFPALDRKAEELCVLEPTTANIYKAYVLLSRMLLPVDALVELVESMRFRARVNYSRVEAIRDQEHNKAEALKFITKAYCIIWPRESTVGVSVQTMCTMIGQALKVHPFILNRFAVRGGTAVPPSVVAAIYKAAGVGV